MLFQIDGDVESLSTIADLLSSASPDSWFGLNHSLLGNTQILGCTRSGLIHPAIQQRRNVLQLQVLPRHI
jgi:hypothetical protein